MNFELTPQMIDKIGFAMEDQKERFAVDVESGELVPVSSRGRARRRYVRLPRWGPAEGFHLMESFVTSLDNPAYREQLSRSLTMGKGVFRAFKDALKQNKEIEKLWFAYKERRLRGVIISWYNSNREARGLAKLPAEPEETEELVMSDFSFTWEVGRSRSRRCTSSTGTPFSSCFPAKPRRLEKRFQEKRRGLPAAGERVVAHPDRRDAVGGAGRIGLGRDRGQVGEHRAACGLACAPRHWASGKSCCGSSSTAMRGRGMQRLITELMGKSLRFSDFFQSVGFAAVAQVMECSLEQLPTERQPAFVRILQPLRRTPRPNRPP